MNNIHIQYYFMSNVFCVIDNQQGVRASGIVHVDIDSLCVRNRILYSYRRFFPWIDRRCMIHEELCRALQLIFDQFDSSPIHTFSNTYWSTNDNKKKNSNVSDRQVVIIVAYVINFLSAPQMDNCHFGRLQERFVNPRFRSAPCDTHHHHYIFLLACSQPLKCPDAVE